MDQLAAARTQQTVDEAWETIANKCQPLQAYMYLKTCSPTQWVAFYALDTFNAGHVTTNIGECENARWRTLLIRHMMLHAIGNASCDMVVGLIARLRCEVQVQIDNKFSLNNGECTRPRARARPARA